MASPLEGIMRVAAPACASAPLGDSASAAAPISRSRRVGRRRVSVFEVMSSCMSIVGSSRAVPIGSPVRAVDQMLRWFRIAAIYRWIEIRSTAMRVAAASLSGLAGSCLGLSFSSRRAGQAEDTHPGPACQDDRQWLHRGRGAVGRRQGGRAARPLRSVAERSSRSARRRASGASTRPIARNGFRSTTASAPSRISAIAGCGARRTRPARAATCSSGCAPTSRWRIISPN